MVKHRMTIIQTAVGNTNSRQWTVSLDGRLIANVLNKYDAMRVAFDRAETLDGEVSVRFEHARFDNQ